MPPGLHRLASRLEHSAGDSSFFEQVIDILELQASRFGKEAVHDGNPNGVEDLA